jgi:hypothetical protein
MDPINIPVATILTLLTIAGLFFARRSEPSEALRFGLILLVYPAVYYLVHPETYYLRPIDPILLILGSYAFLQIKERMSLASPIEYERSAMEADLSGSPELVG